jgi:hypothetical protein
MTFPADRIMQLLQEAEHVLQVGSATLGQDICC